MALEPSDERTDPLERRSPIPAGQPEKPPEEGIPEESPTKPFDLHAGEEAGSPLTAADAGSPFDPAAAAGQQAGEVTQESLNAYANQIGDKVQGLQGQLTEERFAELTSGQRALLDKKVAQFHESVRGVAGQIGLEQKGPEKIDLSGLKELKPYLSYLTQGQQQLQHVASALGSHTKGQISVVGMLRAQAQLVAAERAINFASAVVGKGTDFIKTVMQTQI